jgi:hypothetical protein
VKKLSDRQRRHLIYSGQRYFRRKKRKPRIGIILSRNGVERVFLPAAGRSMPSTFCVVENTEETVAFLKALREKLIRPPVSGTRAIGSRLKEGGKRRGQPRWISSYIDFAKMTHISPTSALVLAAEYDRARMIHAKRVADLGRLFIVNPQTWHQEVLETLVNVGFFDILGIRETEEVRNGDDQRTLRFRSGSQSDPVAIGAMLDEVQQMFSEVGLSADDACFELNGALGEAMENTVRCAYPPGQKLMYPHVGRWWMTGAVSRSQRRLSAAIFDQGVSIPASLSGWKFYEGFIARFTKRLGLQADLSEPTYDGRVIELAIEESATSTMLEKHGKGLAHIKAFVDSCTSGRLTIISRNGFYMYVKGRKPVVKNLGGNIGGTLVEWDVKI